MLVRSGTETGHKMGLDQNIMPSLLLNFSSFIAISYSYKPSTCQKHEECVETCKCH